MTVNKLILPSKSNAVQEKINEIIDNFPSGTTVDQTYNATSANAQSGVAIAGAGFIKNTATGSNSITILGIASNKTSAINIGVGSTASGGNTVAIGRYASSSQSEAIALGYGASATAYSAIQLGAGTNSTAYTFSVGLGNNNNYQLLDGTTGLIPDARISSNIARTSSLATVATTGDYSDLTNKPTIPAAQVNSDWDAISGVAQILNKPTLGTMATESASDYTPTASLATVATSGSYNDLTNKPTIPTVNNGTLTIQKNGTTVGTFTANASNNVTANISVPTAISDLTDDTSTYPIDKAESVTDQNTGNADKMWSGTLAQYNAIQNKNADTYYNITDDATPSAYQAYTKSEVDALIQDALYYKAGDTYTISSAIICPSFVTTSGTSIRFCIVTPKRLDNITTITCNTLITNFRKSDGGYVPSNLWDAKANATVNCNIRGSNMILVGVDYASGYGLTNNTPVGAEINSISLTFS